MTILQNSMRALCFSLWLCPLFSFALIGDWQSYTHLDRIQALISHEGKLFAGTSGGIREVDPRNLSEIIHNNPSDGIRDVDVTGLVETDEGNLWGVSRDGILYRLEKTGEWSFIDRGFAGLGWKMNDRSILSVGNYILLGSNEGLSFFSITGEVIEFSITQFKSARNVSVTALYREGNVLYAGTSDGVYRADIHWDEPLNPPSGMKAFNPQIWEKVTIASLASDTSGVYGVFVIEGDSLTVYPRGSQVSSPVLATSILNQPLVVDGKTYSSITNMDVVVKSGDRIFTGNSTGLYYLEGESPRQISNKKGLPPYRIANIRGSSEGPYFWTLDPDRITSTVYKISEGATQKLPIDIPQFIEPIKAFTRGLNVVSNDEFYLGNWGQGVWHYDHGVTTSYGSGNTCLTGVPGSPGYVVVWSTAPFRDNGIFIGTFHISGRYKISYMDFVSKSVTCFDLTEGVSGLPSNSREMLNDQEVGLPLDLKVLGDSLLIVSHNKGIDLFDINDVADVRGLTTLKTVEAAEALDKDVLAANVDIFGRLWAVTPTGIFYGDNFLNLEPEEDTLIQIESLAESKCNHIREDGLGNLWMGCQDGILYITPSAQQPVGELITYTNKNGLLSNEIADLDINKKTGEIWIVTSKGLSLFQSPGRETPSSLSDLSVYPNPFKAKHEFVVFDNLTSSSEVILLNRGGKVVFHAHPEDIQGGQWRWKGRNESGREVTAGVYYYVIKSGSTIRKGKLVVAR